MTKTFSKYSLWIASTYNKPIHLLLLNSSKKIVDYGSGVILVELLAITVTGVPKLWISISVYIYILYVVSIYCFFDIYCIICSCHEINKVYLKLITANA